jgi:tetratricopeptide (TPR) repeat protein
VAVKLLRGCFSLDSTTAGRFVQEARITAQLQHPGIPPIHEVGKLEDGRPFLAMKLVKGRTLDDLLNKRPTPSTERSRFLAVFEQVCQAVGYAHAHSVIHRDLKPANVMVGAFGEVQVMDWGVAKVIAREGRESSVLNTDSDPVLVTEILSTREGGPETESGSLIGTPAFMPPEQAIGAISQIDDRSDVFGLGAILCVILTGHPPYVGKTLDTIRQMAARGNLDDALVRLAECGGEPALVDLCRRCLDPERSKRPPDGGSVAKAVAVLRAASEERARLAELDRVRAEIKDSQERKHRRMRFVSGVVVAAVLAIGSGVSAWQSIRATEAEAATGKQLKLTTQAEMTAREEARIALDREQRERTAREVAETLTQFLEEMFTQAGAEAQASPKQEANRELTVIEAMDYAARRVEDRFKGRPEIEAAVRAAIGKTYVSTGAYREGLTHLERALSIRRQVLGNAHRDTLGSIDNLGAVCDVLGRYSEAESLYQEALAGRRKLLGHDHPDTLLSLNNLATLYETLGRHADAESLLTEVLAGFQKLRGDDHADTLSTLNNLASVYESQQRYDEAEALYKKALSGYRKVCGDTHPETLTCVNCLGFLYVALGRHAEAEPLYREALAGRRRVLGDAHQSTLTSINNLGYLFAAQGRYTEAESLYKEALVGSRKVLGDIHPDTLASVNVLAGLYFKMHRFEEASSLFREALTGYESRPEKAVIALLTRSNLGLSLLRAGKATDAEPYLLAGYYGLKKWETKLSSSNRNQIRHVTQGLLWLYQTTGQREKEAQWRVRLKELPPEVAPWPSAIARAKASSTGD